MNLDIKIWIYIFYYDAKKKYNWMPFTFSIQKTWNWILKWDKVEKIHGIKSIKL